MRTIVRATEIQEGVVLCLGCQEGLAPLLLAALGDESA